MLVGIGDHCNNNWSKLWTIQRSVDQYGLLVSVEKLTNGGRQCEVFLLWDDGSQIGPDLVVVVTGHCDAG